MNLSLKHLGLSLMISSACLQAAPTQVWELDRSHSAIKFDIDHMGISETSGQFDDFTLNATSDLEDFSDVVFDLDIKTASINTDNAKRDEHLKGKDFFDVAKNPTISFKGLSFKPTKKNTYEVKGSLTMNGATKEVTFEGKFAALPKDPWGASRVGLKVSGVIDRYAFNLKYNSPLDKGGFAIGQEVRFKANIELIKKVAKVEPKKS